MSINDDGGASAAAHHASWNPAFRPDEIPHPMTNSTHLALESKEPPPQLSEISSEPIPVSEPVATSISPEENEDSSDNAHGGSEASDQKVVETGEAEEANGSPVTTAASQESQDAQIHIEHNVGSHDGKSTHEFSGGDDETDPAFGVFRAATDPFQREDMVGRTNSFPVMGESKVPAENGVVTELEINGEKSTQNDEADAATLVVANGDAYRNHDAFWRESADADVEDPEEDFFSQLNTQTKPIYVPPEAESRYEEGIPLVEDVPETPVEQAKHESRLSKIFDGDDDEADDFFSSVLKSSVSEIQPPSVKRKSTSQVLDSISFSQDSPSIDASPSFLQPSDTTGATQSVKKVSSEEDLAARWQAELDDDDLLIDDEIAEDPAASAEQVPETVPRPSNGVLAENQDRGFGTPQSSVEARVQPNPYAPHQPSVSELTQGVPFPGYAQGSTGFVASPYSTQTQERPPMDRAESFVDRSKDGYKSPYDIPMDLTRPRKPVSTHKPVTPPSNIMPPPPPRSSSIASIPPPSASMVSPPAAVATAAAPVATPKNFYEELPPPSRSRPASRGRYTPQPTAATMVAPPLQPTLGQYPGAPAPQPAVDSYFQSQLQQPELMDPYSNLSVPSAPSAGPGSVSRYSPKPPGAQLGVKPTPSPRYSPAPPPQSSAPPPRSRYTSQPASVGSQSNILPFQPRTSSPLAHHEKHAYQAQVSEGPLAAQAGALSPPRPLQPRQTPEQSPIALEQPPQAGVSVNAAETGQDPHKSPMTSQQVSPPSSRYAPTSYVDEFAGRVASEPHYAPGSVGVKSQVPPPPGDVQFAPPRRSQTQSPGKHLSGPSMSMPTMEPFQRPASVHDPSSPTRAVNHYAATLPSIHSRGMSQQLEFIPPTDGQQFDSLERWKGAPIINFGFGGSVTTCFPKLIPRYAAGHLTPMIKPSPGEVRIHQLNEFIPAAENIVRYPGPLRTKSKKKDVIAWLSSKIAEFENEGFPETAHFHPEPHKRHEERILLWKIIRIIVENDGALEGSADIQKSIRSVLSPGLQTSESEQTYGGDLANPAAYQPVGPSSQSDAADPLAVEKLRNNLLAGDREKAVWGAVDNRLWGHAMLISSTLDRSIWKQVVQEFVRREVRSAGANVESLAALYAIFAGNLEESIDELVPASARAGLQMVSKLAGQGPTKNALEGLDSWRETLGLVLSNRSADDHQALVALGRLLASYGRVEASHICYIFARAASSIQLFGGVDDPQASIVLIGADHRQFPTTFSLDEDAVLLTEVYEFATAVLAVSPTAVLPHLQAFKLRHATLLADSGRKTDAQQYCDAITATLKATTKPSPYYHQRLFSEIDELSTRLRQAPSDGTSSWISKPSMEKVSGSMWAKFNSFVAGDDSDAASSGSPKAGDTDFGPFAKVTGTPTVSRSPSVSDLYGSYPVSGAQPIPTASSRYAPGNQYAPNASPEQYRGRSSLDSQRSPSFGFPHSQRRGSQEPSTPGDGNSYQAGPFNPYGSPTTLGYQSTPPQSSYMPLAPVEEDLPGQTQPQQGNVSSRQSSMSGGYHPSQAFRTNSFGQPLHDQEPAAGLSTNSTYEPPTSTGTYGPPSYQPDIPAVSEDAEESPVELKPKKKSFMNDDDDDELEARAAALKKAEKERKDREADEAFRKAAEADAKKPAQSAKKGWFGGWFGGKKESDSSGGPIRAKLGEENSFYYDTNLKKWVNKKDPNSANAAARATPPPPKGPGLQTRAASSGSVPPVGRPPMPSNGPAFVNSAGVDSRPGTASRSGSPAPAMLGVSPPAGLNAIPRSVSTGAANVTPPSTASGLAPPSRPSTSLSNASSIDDLLGAPQPRKGNTVRGKKKGRGYVDVMAK